LRGWFLLWAPSTLNDDQVSCVPVNDLSLVPASLASFSENLLPLTLFFLFVLRMGTTVFVRILSAGPHPASPIHPLSVKISPSCAN